MSRKKERAYRKMAMRGLRKALLAGVYWFFELLSELQYKALIIVFVVNRILLYLLILSMNRDTKQLEHIFLSIHLLIALSLLFFGYHF